MNKWSKLWISLLALLAPMAMASVTIEKSTDVAPGIFFSELPIVTDMVCNETQVFEYTVRNNIAVTVKVNQAIEILNGDDDVVSMFISGGTCGILPSFSLTPGESCTIDVTAISEPCPESKAPASTLVRRALVLVPSTTVQRNPLTSRILFEVVPGPTIAGLTAYIANDDNTNSVSMCPVDESDGSLLTCTVLNDSTFNAPADVILTPKGALTDGATMAYVANSDNDTISVCPVNEDGTFGFCKTPAFSGSFELAFPGLRLSADNTFLYATDYYNDLVWQCPVAADGSLGGACTSFGGDPVSGAFNGPKGRMVLNLANTQTYIPNFNPSNVSICDSVFVTCTTFDDSSAFNSPLGLDIDVSGSYVYVAMSNDEVASCKINGATLDPCTYSTGGGTFDFVSNESNLYMQNYNGYGYIPNDGDDTISVCKVASSTGAIGSCTVADGTILGFSTPASVWIADLSPQLLYVGNATPAISDPLIEVFNLPLTNVSVPIVTIPSLTGTAAAAGFAFDNFGKVYVANYGEGNVVAYTLPLTNASTPTSSFAIPGGEPQGVAFDDTGRLFVSSTDSNIYVYSLPGTLVMTLKSAGDPYQMTFDSDDNLIVASCAPPRLFTYNPPFFNNQTPNVTTVTADCVGGVSTIEGGSGEVLLVTTNTSDLYAYFPLPLTSGSVAVVYDGSAFTAEWGFNLAHDKVNNVYVPDFANGEMDVFGANDPDPSTFNVLGYTPGGVAVQ